MRTDLRPFAVVPYLQRIPCRRFFLGSFAGAACIALALAAAALALLWSCPVPNRSVKPIGSLADESLFVVAQHQSVVSIVGTVALLAASCCAASLLPPLWNKPYMPTYWAQTPENLKTLQPRWLVNDATRPLTSFALPPDAAPALFSLGGNVYAKVYVDVLVFYAFITSLLVLGFGASMCAGVRRCLHRHVLISPHSAATACRASPLERLSSSR